MFKVFSYKGFFPLVKPMIIASSAVLTTSILSGCGGGSSGSESGNLSEGNGIDDIETPISFSPDSERLSYAASESNELFVEEGFTFDMSRNVLLTVQSDSRLAGNSNLIIYGLKESFDHWQEVGEEDRELIAVARTNSIGSYEGLIEISPTIKQLLVTVAELGIENKHLSDVQNNISIVFGEIAD